MKVCSRYSQGAVPLTDVETGSRVRLASVVSCGGLRGRINAMGLIPGTDVEVLAKNHYGTVIVVLNGGRIILGRRAAKKVLVEQFFL